ncbi:hypothetical protein CK203_009968 [Vitis vinifera]|uniref:Uncharacterized protein n=1 Tax=Vitis vinifera TaxID=29760 RepID=A0A438JUZ7_VITVI|nr:hypothetical protein CK203_009968 [Vitis vinifera]
MPTKGFEVEILALVKQIKMRSTGLVCFIGVGRFIDWGALNARGLSRGILIFFGTIGGECGCWGKDTKDVRNHKNGELGMRKASNITGKASKLFHIPCSAVRVQAWWILAALRP